MHEPQANQAQFTALQPDAPSDREPRERARRLTKEAGGARNSRELRVEEILHMKTWMTTIALVVLLVAGAAARQDAQPKELAALQGTWLAVSLNDQSVADAGVSLTISFAGNTYASSMNGEVVETGTFKLDVTKKPLALDLAILTGDDAGKPQLAIVEFTDEGARFGFAQPGDPNRPLAFVNGGAAMVVVVKKAK
jgi:uncharacterized protein (TIGR03067 family)